MPVNRQDDVTGRLVHISNNIDDECTSQFLAHPHGDARCVPCGGEVLGKLRKVRGGDFFRWRAPAFQPHLAGLYAAQCCLPILLELGCNQTVIRITGGVAPLCKRGFILRLLQLEFHDSPLLVQSVHVHLLGLLGCFDRHRFNNAYQLFGDSRIYARAAKAHAARWHVKAVASVDWLGYTPSIGHR